MDLSSEKKKLINKHFHPGGFVIATILGIMGFVFLYYSGLFSIRNIYDLRDVLHDYGHLVIFGIFFFFVCIYVWWLFLVNVIISPKKEVLYLKKKNDEFIFVNRKGKKIICDKITVDKEGYYEVWKTCDYVLFIVNESFDSWEIREKISFWLTWYSPIGLWEDIFLLPIVYFGFGMFLLIFIFGSSSDKMFSLFPILFCIYLIFYDIICKFRNSKK